MEHDDSLSWEKVTFSSVSLEHDIFLYFLYMFFLLISALRYPSLSLRFSCSIQPPSPRPSLSLLLSPSFSPLLPVFSLLSSFREILRSAQGRYRKKKKKAEKKQRSFFFFFFFLFLFLLVLIFFDFTFFLDTSSCPLSNDKTQTSRLSPIKWIPETEDRGNKTQILVSKTRAFKVYSSVMFVDTARETRAHYERRGLR